MDEETITVGWVLRLRFSVHCVQCLDTLFSQVPQTSLAFREFWKLSPGSSTHPGHALSMAHYPGWSYEHKETKRTVLLRQRVWGSNSAASCLIWVLWTTRKRWSRSAVLRASITWVCWDGRTWTASASFPWCQQHIRRKFLHPWCLYSTVCSLEGAL